MKLNYYLKEAMQLGPRPIYLVVHAEGKRTRLFLGDGIETRHWDKRKQRAKNSWPGCDELNDRLRQIEERITTLFLTAKSSSVPISKQQLLEIVRPRVVSAAEKPGLVQLMELYLEAKKPAWAKATYEKNRQLKQIVKEYLGSKQLMPDAITPDWLDSFRHHLNYVRMNNNNSMVKRMEQLRDFMAWAARAGYHSNHVFAEHKISRRKAQRRKKVYLPLPELDKIMLLKLDPEQMPGLWWTRALLITEAFTGLRYSDAQALLANPRGYIVKVKNRAYIDLNMFKTGTDVKIPVHRHVAAVIQDVTSRPRPEVSNSTSNYNLKRLCELAGIDAPVRVVTHRGTIREEETVPKHQLVTTHTGRRSFGTNWVEGGGRLEVLQKIFGHSTLQQTLDYIVLTDPALAKEMDRALGE